MSHTCTICEVLRNNSYHPKLKFPTRMRSSRFKATVSTGFCCCHGRHTHMATLSCFTGCWLVCEAPLGGGLWDSGPSSQRVVSPVSPQTRFWSEKVLLDRSLPVFNPPVFKIQKRYTTQLHNGATSNFIINIML